MNDHIVSEKTIEQFQAHLIENEKSDATVQKYIREMMKLKKYLAGEPVTKEKLIRYRKSLQEKKRATTINGTLSAINSYLQFMKIPECEMKLLKIQRNSFLNEEKELTEDDYHRLLDAAAVQNKERLYHLILTICGTGIRVSEVRYITVEALKRGKAEINMKGKNRVIILPKKLIQKLRDYIQKKKIVSGPIFCTRTGNVMDRSNICHEMKKLAEFIGVRREKVHPHSLRHLFARQFYAVHKNIAHLADVLGHSSIETTRIYVAVSASEHERTMEVMNLII